MFNMYRTVWEEFVVPVSCQFRVTFWRKSNNKSLEKLAEGTVDGMGSLDPVPVQSKYLQMCPRFWIAS